MRARRPSAAIAWRAISSRNVVYSRPFSSRRTKRLFPDCVMNALTSATVTTASAIARVFPSGPRLMRGYGFFVMTLPRGERTYQRPKLLTPCPVAWPGLVSVTYV